MTEWIAVEKRRDNNKKEEREPVFFVAHLSHHTIRSRHRRRSLAPPHFHALRGCGAVSVFLSAAAPIIEWWGLGTLTEGPTP